uniref:Pyridoxamine kinase/Phosphomethylpyrimidine kinase domain-containing protein n=1 Tax=Bionectria ochroleuca TaxID=29856 RepID=A0A8H7KB68_BIOOC
MVQGRVLVVAGSDSSGGAGLEADQKVIAAHGCYAMTATTALTAQNTKGVQDIHIEASLDDIGADVLKTGMLATAETIEMVSRVVTKYQIPSLVIDPVMVSTSGAQLLPHPSGSKLILSEAGQPEQEITCVEDLEAIGRKIRALGPKWVLVKGGHLPFEVVVDVLVGPADEDVVRVQSPYQESVHTHGTGCSLASAIASGLAKGLDVPSAVRSACRYIEAGIRTAPGLGGGHGPLNHFHSTYSLPFSPGYFIEYLLHRPDVKDVWKRFRHHPFVMAMGDGTLPVDSFKGYMVQDYLYLIQFSRANALSAYKSNNLPDIARAAELVTHTTNETKLHLKYCESFGIPLAEILNTEEHQACTAYTRYVLDIGQSEDWLALQLAMAPCLLGYFAVAEMLRDHHKTVRENNTYWDWIEFYVGAEYTEAVRLGSELIEKHILLQSPSRIEELVKIFIHATKMEIGFWEMYPSK